MILMIRSAVVPANNVVASAALVRHIAIVPVNSVATGAEPMKHTYVKLLKIKTLLPNHRKATEKSTLPTTTSRLPITDQTVLKSLVERVVTEKAYAPPVFEEDAVRISNIKKVGLPETEKSTFK